MNIGIISDMKRTAEIMLVEDNMGDVILTKKAFEKLKMSNNITVAKDGMEAMALLRHEGDFATVPTPDIILLDLNLPKKSGIDVLNEIKSDEALRHIPVVILTSSRAEMDVVKSYDLHANSYLTKPVHLESFAEIVKSLENFWFTMVVLVRDAKQTEFS